jgi:hypothetical protein
MDVEIDPVTGFELKKFLPKVAKGAKFQASKLQRSSKIQEPKSEANPYLLSIGSWCLEFLWTVGALHFPLLHLNQLLDGEFGGVTTVPHPAV